MDPLSLIAMASTAFKGIQTLVNQGAEIEAVAQKLGSWYPPLFKKLFDGESVEQQALNSVIAKKKVEEQEKQIRELVTWAYGVETYKEMMQMRREIRAKRERIIYKQRRRQRRMLDVSAIIIGLMISGGVIFATISLIRSV
jgi:hypothetical protein